MGLNKNWAGMIQIRRAAGLSYVGRDSIIGIIPVLQAQNVPV